MATFTSCQEVNYSKELYKKSKWIKYPNTEYREETFFTLYDENIQTEYCSEIQYTFNPDPKALKIFLYALMKCQPVNYIYIVVFALNSSVGTSKYLMTLSCITPCYINK